MTAAKKKTRVPKGGKRRLDMSPDACAKREAYRVVANEELARVAVPTLEGDQAAAFVIVLRIFAGMPPLILARFERVDSEGVLRFGAEWRVKPVSLAHVADTFATAAAAATPELLSAAVERALAATFPPLDMSTADVREAVNQALPGIEAGASPGQPDPPGGAPPSTSEHPSRGE